MTKGKNDNDPTWSRSRGAKAKRKGKVCSRSSLRLLNTLAKRKKLADRRRDINATTCVTRTVELPSTHEVNEESSKLLFMLAIGLTPKTDKPKRHLPVVVLERLHPKIEAEAKFRTKEIVFKIFEERKKELLRRRALGQFTNLRISPLPFQTQPDKPIINKPLKPISSIECVDLVSSEEEASSTSDDEPEVISSDDCSPSYYNHSHVSKLIPISPPCHQSPPVPRKEKIMFSSQPWVQSKPRSMLLKPVSPDAGIFRNWKPESISRMINLSPSSSSSDSSSTPPVSRTKFLSSLKSIPSTSTLSLTVQSFARQFQARSYPNGSYKSPMKITHEEKPASPAQEFILSEDVITID